MMAQSPVATMKKDEDINMTPCAEPTFSMPGTEPHGTIVTQS